MLGQDWANFLFASFFGRIEDKKNCFRKFPTYINFAMFLMPITILCISIVTNFEVGHFLSTVVHSCFLYEIIMSYCERNQKKETNHAGI